MGLRMRGRDQERKGRKAGKSDSRSQSHDSAPSPQGTSRRLKSGLHKKVPRTCIGRWCLTFEPPACPVYHRATDLES